MTTNKEMIPGSSPGMPPERDPMDEDDRGPIVIGLFFAATAAGAWAAVLTWAVMHWWGACR
jgi:hypothetical protein